MCGYDLSPQQLEAVRARVDDPRAKFQDAGARLLLDPPHSYDAAVSELVVNFAPAPARATL